MKKQRLKEWPKLCLHDWEFAHRMVVDFECGCGLRTSSSDERKFNGMALKYLAGYHPAYLRGCRQAIDEVIGAAVPCG